MYIGLFKDRESTEIAFDAICTRGYTRNCINLIMSTETRKKYFPDDNLGKNKSVNLGSPLSNAYKISDAINAGVVLSGESIVVSGPISAGLSGAGAGGFSGGIIESLLGIPEIYASKFEVGIKQGWIVMSIQPRNEEDVEYIEKMWQENNVKEIYKK